MQTFTAALEASLKAAKLPDMHSASIRLARKYAEILDYWDAEDDDDEIAKFGPKFLAALKALGLTTEGTSATSPAKGGETVVTGSSELDAFRARRAAREDRAAPVDSPAS